MRAPEAPVNRWVLRHDQTPITVWENGIAWDPEARRVIWYGGHVGRLYPQSNYTILYDPEQNRFRESQAPTRPQRRCLVHVAYVDSCRRTLTADGGSHHGSVPGGGLAGEYKTVFRSDPRGPWLYDALDDSWEDCRTLPPGWKRAAHAPICHEPNSDAVFGLRGDELCIYSPRLNRVFTRPLPPELRNLLNYGLAADPLRRKLVVFGGTVTTRRPEKVDGKNVYDTVVKDSTWTYDIAADVWTQCAPRIHPPATKAYLGMPSLQMVWHNASGTILLVQSADRAPADGQPWPPAELWSFDAAAGQWARTPVDEAGPRPVFAGLAAYAPEPDLLFLFGGGTDGAGEGENPQAWPGSSRQVWSCRVRVPGRTPVAPAGPERILVTAGEQAVTIQWPAQPGVNYDVFRAPAAPLPGSFERITASPVADGRLEDRSAERGKVYAYQVAAVGAARRSLPAFNQPWRPAGLVASVESAREVRLRWKANSEADLAGYRVYRARGAGVEKGEGRLLAPRLLEEPRFVDSAVDLSDGVICSYWVTAVNRAGIESGASPLAYTAPDAPANLTAPEGVALSDGVGNRLGFAVDWTWPADVKVAGFNVYHATEHIDTLLAEGGYERFWKLWTKVNDRPIPGREFVMPAPPDGPRHHYFYVRAVNVLGQEGFLTDIVSPTDRRFRP